MMIAVYVKYLVNNMNLIAQTAHISKTFIRLMLLPIVNNAAKHITAVVIVWKDKMNLAIRIAIGSSLQIALLITPFLVILGWAMDRIIILYFGIFETVVLFGSDKRMFQYIKKPRMLM